MIRKGDCIELGVTCADVCKALDQRTNGRQEDMLSQPVSEAIRQLAT